MNPTTPSFPVYITLPVWGVTLVVVLFQLRRLREVHVGFLLLAIWLRYTLAVFHEYTYPPLVFGLSAIALSSIAVVLAGVLLIGARNMLLRKLEPIYVIILLALISAGINQSWIGAVNVTLKWLYLTIFALVTYIALERHGPDSVFRAVAMIFAAPVLLQWLSIAWGLETVNEDRTLSFIGGYQHQQAFSIILLTLLYVTVFSPGLPAIIRFIRLPVVAVGLAYANYRTSILSAAIPFATLAVTTATGKLVPKQRAVALVFLGAVTAVVVVGIVHLAQDRFADLGTVLDKGGSLIQPPEYFTVEEKRLFSGRIYLWSAYISEYMRGDSIHILFGFGPESWVERFPLYAHNTFVSQLYELGLFGLAALVWLLGANVAMAARTQGTPRINLLSCHLGFVVLNITTMPFWTLEGDILYAMLLAQTWYLRSQMAAVTRVVGSAPDWLRVPA